jgi:hypothetical protein
MSYVLFTSYARADSSTEKGKEQLQRFLGDLAEAVGGLIADQRPRDEQLYFRDSSSIQLGTSWPMELADALSNSKICLALYSPAYFVSDWGGREIEIFRRRKAPIIPVIWVPASKIPESIKDIQYNQDEFPIEYLDRGLKQLMLQPKLEDAYQECILALARRIVSTYSPAPVTGITFDLGAVESAWKHNSNGAKIAGLATISKSCFVFLARSGWHWKPFPNDEKTIGAFSQLLSGQLGLEYEALSCDNALNANLRQRKQANVPTLLLIDPASLQEQVITDGMVEYDSQYLLNCGALVVWPEGPPISTADTSRWKDLQTRLLPQKTASPPPHHEWQAIFSPSDLEGKVKAVLEGIKLRLLQVMLSGEGEVPVRKAENPNGASTVAENGTLLTTAPQLFPSTGA